MAQPIYSEHYSSQERAVELSPKNSLSDEDIQGLVETPLAEYDVGVERISTERRDDLDTDFGRYWQRNVTMSDGHRHTELLGLSSNPKAHQIVASIPAWWTRLDGGMNLITSNDFLRNGLHTLTKGITENRPASLSRGAHDLHAVLDQADDGFGFYFDTDVILFHGDSNGGMQGAGVLAYAPAHNRVVADAFLVDPCVVRKPQASDIEKLLAHPSYIPKEIFSVSKQIIRMIQHPDLAIGECAKTLEKNPGRVLGNIMLTQALFGGEFGLLLAHVPPEQRVHFLLFTYSIANQKSMIRQILDATGSSATAEIRTGTHTSIADPRVRKAKVDYITPPPGLEIAA